MLMKSTFCSMMMTNVKIFFLKNLYFQGLQKTEKYISFDLEIIKLPNIFEKVLSKRKG